MNARQSVEKLDSRVISIFPKTSGVHSVKTLNLLGNSWWDMGRGGGEAGVLIRKHFTSIRSVSFARPNQSIVDGGMAQCENIA